MTAKKRPEDLRPRSVPTTAEERNALRAILAKFGPEWQMHPSTNGATLRARVLELMAWHYIDPSQQIVQPRADVEQEAIDEDATRTAEALESLDAPMLPDEIARARKARLSAIAKKAVETRRRNQAAREAAAISAAHVPPTDVKEISIPYVGTGSR